MSIHGDMLIIYYYKNTKYIYFKRYYEGKEYEVKKRNYKPGKISEELREALGFK